MLPPEILAPVGDWNMLRAAVHNGADAIYLGMPGFNARGRAPTLELAELDAMIRYARLYGVRVLIAFNVLVFQRELSDAIEALMEVLPLRPDAFIVQDIGLVRLIRALAPEQLVHASTQMTVSSSEAIKATEDLGMVRYVLARELSIEDVASIRKETEKELEVFVHGALCVSYSGQCLTSESMGGRSANRGQCAQSCRLEYDLLVDGEQRDMGSRRYLVSPQDLCGIEDVPRLLEAGVNSFKIEGRLKSPAYVASTSRSYKEATLAFNTQRAAEQSLLMRRTYARGHFNGWMNDVDHQRLVDPLLNSHFGIEIGRVIGTTPRSVRIRASDKPEPGDGIVFLNEENGSSCGSSVYAVAYQRDGTIELSLSNDFNTASVSSSMRVFINASPHTEAMLKRSFTDRNEMKRIPISVHVAGSHGSPLVVTATDISGNTAVASSSVPLEPASRAPLSQDFIWRELGSLGGTVYQLEAVTFELAPDSFLHNREIKTTRRALTDALDELRTCRSSLDVDASRAVSLLTKERTVTGHAAASATLNVLIRDMSQIDAVAGLDVGTVFLDFEFGKEYATAANQIRDMGFKVGIATTRILKPGERSHLKVIERIRPDEVLVRNLGALHYFKDSGLSLCGDFSLNAANSLTAEWLFTHGISRLCPSYDLNGEQLIELVKASDSSRFEVTVHQYMPAFHMEHCVFAAFLSSGSSYRDCGRPCEKHRVELRDRKGGRHPLKADAECRNTMFNGAPQSTVQLIPDLIAQGVTTFRIEGLFESPSELRSKIETYSALLRKAMTPQDALLKLGVVEKYGVTNGQLYAIGAYKDRKKEFVPLGELKESSDPGLRKILSTLSPNESLK